MGNGKLVLGYVHPTEVSTYFHNSMMNLLVADFNGKQRIVNGGGRVTRYSSANISNARNGIVKQFLEKSTAEWLLMIDADMNFTPDTVDALLDVASKDKAPVVGGLCFGTHDGVLFPTLYDFRPDDDGVLKTYRYDEFPDNAMFQVGGTGAAFLLIHRNVLVAVEAKAFSKTFPWFEETSGELYKMGPTPVGEDVTFCLRVQLAGFPVFVHTGVEIGHHKSVVLTAEQYRLQREGLKNV